MLTVTPRAPHGGVRNLNKTFYPKILCFTQQPKYLLLYRKRDRRIKTKHFCGSDLSANGKKSCSPCIGAVNILAFQSTHCRHIEKKEKYTDRKSDNDKEHSLLIYVSRNYRPLRADILLILYATVLVYI